MYDFHVVRHRAVARMKKGGPIKVRRGRKQKIDNEIKQTLRSEAKTRDLQKNSFTRKAFRASVHAQLKKKNDANPKVPIQQIPSISEKTISRCLKEVAPEVCAVPTVQNARRREALCDGYNAVSLAALWPAVLGIEDPSAITELQDDPGTVNPDLLFNTDQTSLMVGEKKVEVAYLAEESKEKLQEMHLSVGVTKEHGLPEQQRSVQLLTTTNASGELVITVIKIRDDSIKKTVKKVVSDLHFSIFFCSY